MAALIRSSLALVVIVLALVLGIAHGIRGLAFAGVLILIWAARGTRPYRAVERTLVRVTGSRTRAGVLVLSVIIAAGIAVNLYEAMH